MAEYAHQVVDQAPPKEIANDPRYKVYRPYGACEDLLYCKEFVLNQEV